MEANTKSQQPRITVIAPRSPDNAKLRVAAYARVSSDSEDQVNSYIAQVDFYTRFISSNKDWEMTDVYADEGLSGLDAQKRDEFNRMLEDCRAGKIDRILVKSISRFARNTKDYILYMRELLRLGVTIYFEKENIDTGKMSSEQIASIYGAFAQMESTNHSSNMRTSVRMRMENGMYTPPSAPYGYRLVNKRLEIVPEEAEVVARIYAEYLSGQGYDSIASELNQSKTTAGRDVWHSSAIHYILTNVTYTGDMVWQKTFAGNTIPFKTVRNKGQKPRYFAEDCHEPIISKSDFQKVQELIAARQKQFSGMQIVTDSVYQGHIFCGSCGAKCRRKPDREHVYWVCNRHDVKKSRCPVPQIPETEITAAVQRMCSKLKINAESILAPLLAQLKELRKRELRSNQKISDIDKELARLAEQNLVLTRLKSKGYIDSTLYFAQQDEINHKLLELKKLRRNIMALANEEGQIQATESMIEYLADAPEWMERIEPELFDSLVKEILLMSAGEIRIKLYNGLELPETIKRMAR